MGIFATALKLGHIVTPSAPPSGSSALYFKSDGELYAKDSDGFERIISAPTPSLFINPSFDVWVDGVPEGWTNFWMTSGSTVTKDTSEFLHGSSSVRIFNPSGGNGRITVDTPGILDVNPGDVVNYSIYAKRSASSTGARLQIGIGTKKDANPGFFDAETQFQYASYALGTGWNEYRASFQVPSDHNRLLVDLNPYTASSGVDITVWLDKSSSTITTPSGGSNLMTGEVKLWPFDEIPEGYLPFDGSIHNIADYPALGTKLKNKYGGNGTTTFGLPDVRRRFLVGVGAGLPVGHTEGLSDEVSRDPKHSHSASGLTTSAVGDHVHGLGVANILQNTAVGGNAIRIIGGTTGSNGGHSHNVIGSTGDAGGFGGFPHFAINVIIKT